MSKQIESFTPTGGVPALGKALVSGTLDSVKNAMDPGSLHLELTLFVAIVTAVGVKMQREIGSELRKKGTRC
jgi:uncharacterized transporter YbjL